MLLLLSTLFIYLFTWVEIWPLTSSWPVSWDSSVYDRDAATDHAVSPAAVVCFSAFGLLLTRSCEWKLLHVMWLFCVCSSKWRLAGETETSLDVFCALTGRVNGGEVSIDLKLSKLNVCVSFSYVCIEHIYKGHI